MIIEWMINAGLSIFDGLMSMLGVLPDLPEAGISAIDYIFNIMSDAVGLAGIPLINIKQYLNSSAAPGDPGDKMRYKHEIKEPRGLP